jgi:hypothetical protein
VSDTPQSRVGQSEADLADQSLQFLWNRFAGRDESHDLENEKASAPIALGTGGTVSAGMEINATDSAKVDLSSPPVVTSPTNAPVGVVYFGNEKDPHDDRPVKHRAP